MVWSLCIPHTKYLLIIESTYHHFKGAMTLEGLVRWFYCVGNFDANPTPVLDIDVLFLYYNFLGFVATTLRAAALATTFPATAHVYVAVTYFCRPWCTSSYASSHFCWKILGRSNTCDFVLPQVLSHTPSWSSQLLMSAQAVQCYWYAATLQPLHMGGALSCPLWCRSMGSMSIKNWRPGFLHLISDLPRLSWVYSSTEHTCDGGCAFRGCRKWSWNFKVPFTLLNSRSILIQKYSLGFVAFAFAPLAKWCYITHLWVLYVMAGAYGQQSFFKYTHLHWMHILSQIT